MMRKTALTAAAVAALAAAPAAAVAAVADGNGPWADRVTEFKQGKRKNGTSVLAARSDPAAAVGAAESAGEGTFTSLGFGGTLTLRLTSPGLNGPGSDLAIVERTYRKRYPDEQVDVWVQRATPPRNWVKVADDLVFSGMIALPGSVPSFRAVRLTDVSDPKLFRANGDGYDVDGVRALHPAG